MFVTRSLVTALISACLVTFAAPGTASACHDGECPAEISSLTVGFLAVDAGLLAFDLVHASSDTRPSRLYGSAELAVGLIQYPVVLGLVFDEGNNYHLSASIQAVVATGLVAHGAYVLVRGPKSAANVQVTPSASRESAGISVSGRF